MEIGTVLKDMMKRIVFNFSCTHLFKCKDQSKCLHFSKVCDDNKDCIHGDDEISCNIPYPLFMSFAVHLLFSEYCL